MNLEQFKNMTVGKSIGFNGSYGECGGYASYWFSELTGNKYQFAYGKPNINAQWAIGSDCYTAWNVATQSNWGAMGFEKIDNPSFSQLKAGDIFFVSARSGLSTGHVGIVYSVANDNVTTLEQNFGGARYVQYMAGANSWSYYGGFTCVVRPKQNKPQPPKLTQETGEFEMYLIFNINKNCYYICNGFQARWVKSERELNFYLGKDGYNKKPLPVTKMYDSEFRVIYPKPSASN